MWWISARNPSPLSSKEAYHFHEWSNSYLKQLVEMLANNYYWSSETIWLLNIGLCLTIHYIHAIHHHQREFHSYNWYGIYDYLGNVGIQVPWPLLQHRTYNNHGQLHQTILLGFFIQLPIILCNNKQIKDQSSISMTMEKHKEFSLNLSKRNNFNVNTHLTASSFSTFIGCLSRSIKSSPPA